MDENEDKLFTCSWCQKIVEDDVIFDVICCELPDALKDQFIKEESGRVVSIMLSGREMFIGVPAKDSEVAMSGADITFMCCSEVCRSTIELILDEAGFEHMGNERAEN